jgi:NADH-quinone oxidoreductase subunit H
MTHLTPFHLFLLLTVLKIAVVLLITLTAVAYTVLLERKVLGRMQNRWGPSRTGPFGLLQPLADGIKLFLKEDLMPLSVERPLFVLAPMIALSCALISISVVPFGAQTMVKGVDLFEIANLNIGLHRRLRHRALRLELQQQVLALRQPALHGADDQL